ncbi:MFS transporter [Alteraurantiacibacter aestuarii]|uniref:MFS transporter n=1 Tax=Alteraurantiacibacter aestuarii TaxID=650004 RepID=A0A844ZL15_9SPHN|nr:MFS transporter [Alteraurantiacibacter aestuarii]MXO88505.1 MFS transporter [Alteraurantiacibacter aestuarii]
MHVVDPRIVMRERPMNLKQYGVVALCVLINMIDGYDILALAQAGSALKTEWGMSDAALGTLLAMNLVGMAVGALGVSPVADQWGRRPAMLICLLFMSIGMAISAGSDGFLVMATGRLITGIGIGGMTSTAGTLALEYASQKRREFATSAVAAAYPVGTIIGAYVAVAVLDTYGWRGIFWVGGSLSAILFPIAFIWLPESLDFLLTRQPKGALETTNKVLRRMRVPEISQLPPRPQDSTEGSTALSEILQPVHRNELIFKLFIAHALNMFAWYFIINWGPPLVAEAGASDALGARYSAWVSYGGIIGGLSAGFFCGVVGVKRMMWLTMVSLAILITLFGMFVGNPGALLIIAPLMGAALFGSAVANWLTIAYAFPPYLRATGLGFATTAGRVGSIFGPIVGGALLGTREAPLDLGFATIDISMSVAAVCAVMAVPAILSALTFNRARRVEPGR